MKERNALYLVFFVMKKKKQQFCKKVNNVIESTLLSNQSGDDHE